MLPVDYVTLAFSAEADRAALREISGHEEWMIQGVDTLTAICLLDQLLVAVSGSSCIIPGSASQLTPFDRDRLLAAVYRRTYGDAIIATLPCRQCGKPFDLDFDLRELDASLSPKYASQKIKREGEVFQLLDGIKFRLPKGVDELDIAHLEPERARSELLRRCVLAGDPKQAKTVQDAMQLVAPLLDLDLQATCPDCSFVQAVHFDMQRYLLTAILSGQSNLAYQVHLLASNYAWSLDAILSLPRSQRLMFVSLIEYHPLQRMIGRGQ